MSIKMRVQAVRDLVERYHAVFVHAWKQRHTMQGRGYTSYEAQFLPASLALQETPPSPAPRVAMWLLVVFAGGALVWVFFGKVDVVTNADGKIVPSDRVKTIRSLERANVKAIRVTDGQFVHAGDVLIELNGATTRADLERTNSELASARLQVERSQALLRALDTGHFSPLARPDGASDEMLSEAQSLLSSEYGEYTAKRTELAADEAQKEAELHSTQELVHKLEQTVPIAKQTAEDYKSLADKNFMSRHGYLEKEQTRIEQEGDLANQRSRLDEIAASLRSARAQEAALLTTTRRAAMESASEGIQKSESLEQDLLKARSLNEDTLLTAPVDGTVQQLAVHTLGGVVKEAEDLLIIVPRDNSLEIEAAIENKDIGFVNAGQPASIKIATFEYTKYGTIPATVSNVSNDAVSDEKKGLIYTARVKMARSTLNVEGKVVNLSPGMSVSVEIKTGRRRLIEYFLSPFMQYAHESLRER